MQISLYIKVIARKHHQCDSGYGQIFPGDTYRNTRIAFDGRVFTWKQCMACDEAMQESDRHTSLYPEEAFPPGWAKEDGVGCAKQKETQ